jgi:hypothetical protein
LGFLYMMEYVLLLQETMGGLGASRMPKDVVNPAQLIRCAGTYRSGSTWLYNILRLMFPHACIVKGHPPDLGQYEFVLTSHRDLRRVAASLMRKWGYQPNYGWNDVKSAIRETVSFHDFWVRHPKLVYDMKYETMMADKAKAVDEIGRVTGIENVEGVLERVELIKPPSKHGTIDAVTKYHWNHITTDDYASLSPLTPEQVDEIQREFVGWQERNGYL